MYHDLMISLCNVSTSIAAPDLAVHIHQLQEIGAWLENICHFHRHKMWTCFSAFVTSGLSEYPCRCFNFLPCQCINNSCCLQKCRIIISILLCHKHSRDSKELNEIYFTIKFLDKWTAKKSSATLYVLVHVGI